MERFLTHNPNTSQEIVHQEPQEHANHIDLQSISHPTQHKQTHNPTPTSTIQHGKSIPKIQTKN